MDATKARKLVSALRNRLNDREAGRYAGSVTQQQQRGQKASKTAHPVWLSRAHLPIPTEANVTQKTFEAIRSLGCGGEVLCPVEATDVDAEWIGFRQVTESLSDGVSEKEKYKYLRGDLTNNLVLLYAHGGGFFIGSPAASRNTTAKLAKLTGGCCLSVQYRLSPQTPFPGAVLDLLVTYLSLLYPLAGSFHDPIPSTSIVLTGDSAGACLCLSLLQLILELGRMQKTSGPTVHWNGQEVPVPVPAGLAASSAWVDQTRALPSWRSNREYDIFGNGMPRWMLPDFPACSAWPTKPSRGDIYCDLSVLDHPLVSPTAAKDWTGAPPLLFICGEERVSDGNKVIAQRASSQGVSVIWQEYAVMPHIFMLFLEDLPHSRLCLKKWAEFCMQCVQNRGSLKTNGSLVEVDTLHSKDVDMKHLTTLTVEDALVLMRAQKSVREVWAGPTKMRSTL